jgi:hypothetical protein
MFLFRYPIQILEDPFTSNITLDGIDVREELEVLLYKQLINTRKLVFPDAPVYPALKRAAILSISLRLLLYKVAQTSIGTSGSKHSPMDPPTRIRSIWCCSQLIMLVFHIKH